MCCAKEVSKLISNPVNQCDERLKTKVEDSTRLVTLGSTGRKYSKSSIGSHGHVGDTSPTQTRKTPKDRSTHESEEHGCRESVGWYAVYMSHV